MFSETERRYLEDQPLARIATVSGDGEPDVAPVGFDFDGEHFYVGGRRMERTYKYKNVQHNSQLAFVVDDLASTTPWRPRGIKIHGRGELVERDDGYVGGGTYIKITPERKWAWGIEETVS